MRNFNTIESTVIYLLSIGTYPCDSNIFPSEIARELCGSANAGLAIKFMNGDEDTIGRFLSNVSFNGEDSDPYILRAIQLHLIYKCSDK